MLTVRIIEATGHEELYQTGRVASQPGNQIVGGERIIFVERPDGSMATITSGTVYVMNDAGKTVAAYHLNSGPDCKQSPIAA